MPRKCTIQTANEWETSSIALLEIDDCLERFDVYSIRFHDSTRHHFDYAIGNVMMDFCIDFFLPKPVTIPGYNRHEYKGKEGHVLTKKELSRFAPVLPEKGKSMKLKFMPVHPRDVLVSKKGLVHEIDEGEYGAGEWFVVEQGEARIIKRNDHFLLSLGNRYFSMVPAYGDYLLVRR